MKTPTDNGLTRLQFFGRMRKLGFAKSRMQMSRNSITYINADDAGSRVTVVIPKGHEGTFHISGDTPNGGIFVESIPGGRVVNWGTPVDTKSLGLNMLEVCLGLCSGDIQMVETRYEGE